MRAGAQALSLLAVPLNVHVLTALEDEAKPLVDLRRAAGSPPQTTMRGHLRKLAELDIVERRGESGFPGSVDYQLGTAGSGLLKVADALQDWLTGAPEGPLELGTVAAKSAVKALVDGWSSTIVRALSAHPLSLTELNKLISGLNYPSLERRLAAMRLAGQIEARPSQSRGTPYAATEWLRRAVGPLLAGAQWERQNRHAERVPLGRIDIEATFLLAIPLLSLPPDVSGACRLAVETPGSGDGPAMVGAAIVVENGRIASCVSRLRGESQAWAAGSTSSWLSAVLEEDAERLEIGGDHDLAMAILEGLSATLTPVRNRLKK